jgi:hypothetical protein
VKSGEADGIGDGVGQGWKGQPMRRRRMGRPSPEAVVSGHETLPSFFVLDVETSSWSGGGTREIGRRCCQGCGSWPDLWEIWDSLETWPDGTWTVSTRSWAFVLAVSELADMTGRVLEGCWKATSLKIPTMKLFIVCACTESIRSGRQPVLCPLHAHRVNVC